MSHRYENNKKNNIANANRDDSYMLTIYGGNESKLIDKCFIPITCFR